MKDGTAGVVIEESVGLNPKMNSYLVDDNSEHKKEKGMNGSIVGTISHNEYKDILLNNKNISHSINRTQSNDRIIGTYEINKISEDDKK